MLYKQLTQKQNSVTLEDVDAAFAHKEHYGLGMYEQQDLVRKLMREDGADFYGVFMDVLNEYFLRHPDLHKAWRAIDVAKRSIVCHDLFYGLIQEMRDEEERQAFKADVERKADMAGVTVDEFQAMDVSQQLLAQIRGRAREEHRRNEEERNRRANIQSDVEDVFKTEGDSVFSLPNDSSLMFTVISDDDETVNAIFPGEDNTIEYPIHRAIENLAEKSKRDDFDDAMKVVE